jgi:hypothetical protein
MIYFPFSFYSWLLATTIANRINGFKWHLSAKQPTRFWIRLVISFLFLPGSDRHSTLPNGFSQLPYSGSQVCQAREAS